MRVTRSKSGRGLQGPVKPKTSSRVEKVKNSGLKISHLEIESQVFSGDDTSETFSKPGASGVGKTSKSSKLKAVPKTNVRPHIEQVFAHIQTPTNLELPPSFIAYHTPDFIDGVNHVLKIDPSLYPAIVFGNFQAFAKEEGVNRAERELIEYYWFSLVSSVISQQVSGSAANAIKGRFRALFSETPTPAATLKIPLDTLKAVGLSNMKLKYVVHISEVFSDPCSRLSSAEFYKECSTQELIEELTKLKGIGEWSAKMFAVFTLKGLNIFAFDDLGVARGVARYLQVRPRMLEETKTGVHAIEELKTRLKRKSKFHMDKSKRDWTPLHDEYVKFLARRFEPYQTVFMLVMWRLSSTNIDAMETGKE